MNYTDGVISNRSNKKQINRRDLLEIDNILVWEVSNDSNREYFVSLQGYSEETGMTRVMVSGGKRESTIIKKYQREGFDITSCSAACRMTVREEDAYKKDLNNEELYQKYISIGSLPYTTSLDTEDDVSMYLSSVYNDIIIKDRI